MALIKRFMIQSKQAYIEKTAPDQRFSISLSFKCKRHDGHQNIRIDVADLGPFSKTFVPAHRKSQPNTLTPNTLVICTRAHPGRIRAERKVVAESTFLCLIFVPGLTAPMYFQAACFVMRTILSSTPTFTRIKKRP